MLEAVLSAKKKKIVVREQLCAVDALFTQGL
jgi:hypothetical protein